MRKLFLIVCMAIVSSISIKAQSYLVTDIVLNHAAICCYTVNLSDTAYSVLPFKVKNISDSTKKTRVHKHIISQTNGHDIYFDFKVTMYAPFVNYSMPVNIAAGQELPASPGEYGFNAEWLPNGYPGTSVVQYTIYDSLNVADSVGIRITYNATPTSVQEIAANEVCNIYPNPATNVLFISLPAGRTQLLTITNHTGEIIRTEELWPGKNAVNISHFEGGIYFYRFDNDRARKLVILK